MEQRALSAILLCLVAQQGPALDVGIACMNRRLYKDAFGWGFMLWLIGYGLGMVLSTIVPPSMIGWIIMPIGTLLTLWVLYRQVKGESIRYYLLLAVIWTLIAVVCDYLFLVKAFNPADGYYKLDVYLYYGLTFVLPVVVGWRKSQSVTSP